MQRKPTPSIGLLAVLTFSFGFLIVNGALLALAIERRTGGLVLAGIGAGGMLVCHVQFWRARARMRREA